MICERWDVVIVPFPFTDRAATKRRPALTLSGKAFNAHGYTILAMITSASHSAWPGDCAVKDLSPAGLTANCVIRLKVFTLDNRLMLRKSGSLSDIDRKAATRAIRSTLFADGRRGSTARR